MDNNNGRKVNIFIGERREIAVSGVIDVVSFGDEQVVAETSEGILIICGADFHLEKLDLNEGELKVTGCFARMGFTDKLKKDKQSFWAKLAK